jgi:hypothetical protein
MRIIDIKTILCLASVFRTACSYSQTEPVMGFPGPGQVRLTESILAEGIE